MTEPEKEPHMNKFLGEYTIDIKETPYANYGPAEWALHFIECYGGIDGAHHKQWVLDQVARILCGTPVVVTEARWLGGQRELRFHVHESPSEQYKKWVAEVKAGEDGPETYTWDKGITP